ncbi:MAG: ATP-dependent RNA helicase, partial [Bryobacteraceae bacterium]|nr:ATP-dependent RNA helicase [Bryobacteraceae bacterium]
MRAALPIDALLTQITETIGSSRNLILQAEPGAGKTTRVPPALLEVTLGDILVLEPRRLPARLAARRVAEELGETVGETVGYRVRFEEQSSRQTRLWFITEGLLTRRLLSDPHLEGVSAVILDEFHERHIETDLALALLRRLQQTLRPDLQIVVMSATLDSGPLARYLEAPVIHAPGRVFDVAVSYAGHSALSVEEQVAASVNILVQTNLTGHVLIFLAGAGEIRRCLKSCESIARSAGLLSLPLHGDLSPDEQDRAVSQSQQQKLIFSTNVAESSVTIEGVSVVIDSGLARIATDSISSGLPTLEVRRISKASAIQRAGRAGRTRNGQAIRLYSQDDFARRPSHDVPEIHRRELAQVVLTLRAMGIDNAMEVEKIEWLDAPPAESVQAAEELLNRLQGKMSAARLAELPVHPRIARLLLEAKQRGVVNEACRIAVHLSASGVRNLA